MKKYTIYSALVLALSLCITIFSGCSGKQTDDTSAGSEFGSSGSGSSDIDSSEDKEPEYIIPDVLGMTVKKAKKVLDKQGISYTIKQGGYSEQYKKGRICEQSIVGESNKDSVELTKSRGLVYSTGDLSGMNYKMAAKNVLKPFKKKLRYTYSTEYGKGQIVRSGFSNRSYLSKGDSGEVVISNGRYNKNKVNGRDISVAKKQFPGAKITITYKFHSARRGKVLNCHVGNAAQKNNIPVSFVLSDGMKVKVPDVTGLSYEKAAKKLKKKGIQWHTVYSYDGNVTTRPTSANGKVLRQNKKSSINKKNPITLTVLKPALLIISMRVNAGEDYYDSFSNMSIKNISNKAIASAKIVYCYYNRVGEKMGEYEYDYVGPLYDANYNADYDADEDLCEMTIPEGLEEAAAIRPVSADVTFMDRSRQHITYSGNYWYTQGFVGNGLYDD